MATPTDILDVAYERAEASGAEPIVKDPDIQNRVEYICRYLRNRAPARLVLAGLLAKAHRPEVDIRKPYTEIGDPDVYSGRSYDEGFIADFINKHGLPVNATTAFLTPALRNINFVLTPDVTLVGRPKELYRAALQLLSDVHMGKVAAEDLLVEMTRCLLQLRDEQQQRIISLLSGLKHGDDTVPLSAEAIVDLIQRHMSLPNTSRLPTLVVAAAYHVAEKHLGERMLPLRGHNAADLQTGALGDIDITLMDDGGVMTSYEMKDRQVTTGDIDHALQKIAESGERVQHYVFITTHPIDKQVAAYAEGIYEQTGGIEVVILDCLSFLRHFLHLFHRLRMPYLEAYQELMLAEPTSAVSQSLREAFLALRQAIETSL